MRNPRVDVRMGRDFYTALCAFAVEHQMTPSNAMLWATAALLSKSHRWDSKVYGRPRAQRANGKEPRGGG